MLMRAFDRAVMPLRCVFCGTRTREDEHNICGGCDADLPRHRFVGPVDPESRAPFNRWLMARVPEEAITVQVGQWDPDTRVFVATSVEPNAVRVFGQLDNEPFSFGRVLGPRFYGAPATGAARTLPAC